MFAELVKERKEVERKWREANSGSGEEDSDNDDDDDDDDDEVNDNKQMIINLDFAEDVARELIGERVQLRGKVVEAIGKEKYEYYKQQM